MAVKDDTMSLADAARFLGVHRNTLRRWADSGRIAEVRVGTRRDRRFPRSDLSNLKVALDARDEATAATAAISIPPAQLARMREALAQIQASPGIAALRDLHLNAIPALSSSVLASMTQTNAPSRLLSESIARMLDPLTSGVLQDAARYRLELVELAGVMATQQTGIALMFEQMSRSLQPRFAEQLIAAVEPSRLALTTAIRIAAHSEQTIAAQRAAAVIDSYHEFVGEVTERLPAEPSEGQAGVAVAEIRVGSEILESGEPGLRRLGGFPGAGDDGAFKPNILSLLAREVDQRRTQLLRLPAGDLHSEIQQLTGTRAASVAHRLFVARARCIRTSELLGLEPVFKSTVDTEDASVRLTWTAATSQDLFKAVVEWLFKLIYESSGDLNRVDATFKSDDSAFADLRRLRHYYDHDLRHGSESAVRKKLAAVGDIFRSLAGTIDPQSQSDWLRAQISLVTRLAEVLEAIANHLEASVSPDLP